MFSVWIKFQTKKKKNQLLQKLFSLLKLNHDLRDSSVSFRMKLKRGESTDAAMGPQQGPRAPRLISHNLRL